MYGTVLANAKYPGYLSEALQQAHNIIEVDMVSHTKKKQTYNRLLVSNEVLLFDEKNCHMSWLK